MAAHDFDLFILNFIQDLIDNQIHKFTFLFIVCKNEIHTYCDRHYFNYFSKHNNFKDT